MLKHWQRQHLSSWSSTAARRADAEEHMGRARERGVHPFHMSETIDRALKAKGHEGWEKLRNAPDLEQREGECSPC